MFLFSKSRGFPRSNKTYKLQNFIPHLHNFLCLPSICSTHTTVPPNPTFKFNPHLSAKSIHYTRSHKHHTLKNHLKNPIKPIKSVVFSIKRICKNTVMFHVKHCPYYIIITKIKTFQKSIPNQIFYHHLKTQTHKSHIQFYLDTNIFIIFSLVCCLNHRIFLKVITNSRHAIKI